MSIDYRILRVKLHFFVKTFQLLCDNQLTYSLTWGHNEQCIVSNKKRQLFSNLKANLFITQIRVNWLEVDSIIELLLGVLLFKNKLKFVFYLICRTNKYDIQSNDKLKSELFLGKNTLWKVEIRVWLDQWTQKMQMSSSEPISDYRITIY